MRPFLLGLSLSLLAAAAARAGNLEFVVIGDTRPRFESESFQPFEQLIMRINALNPALVVNLGDLIYGYGPASKEKQWDKYQAVGRTIKVPYYQIPGNHDTHSKAARRIYGRRFGKFYQSFDYGDCHFVLLDNTESERWGYLGPIQLAWLKNDLNRTRAASVFVFLHFPVWEAERITPEYYELWKQTLHPLFKASRVKAVFGGHYHAYGPTREFDGIRYFITGGGGAELRPEYKKLGGGHHFMRVQVSGETLAVRVVTEQAELTDSEADVMGGIQFAARHVSRIGIKLDPQGLREGLPFTVAVNNPYQEALSGEAEWLLDASSFSVFPATARLQIPPGGTHQFTFQLKALRDTAMLGSLPLLEFNVVSGRNHHRFRREVRFLQELKAPLRLTPPGLHSKVTDWNGIPPLPLGGGSLPKAELRSCHDKQKLYVALTVPVVDVAEGKESGFSDEVQIGLARRESETDFGSDFLRLGLNSDTPEVRDKTPGHKAGTLIPGVSSICRSLGDTRIFELAIPLRLLSYRKAGASGHLILDLSFLAPDVSAGGQEPPVPNVNTFSYRIRYGIDSLVPVYFVELDLEGKP